MRRGRPPKKQRRYVEHDELDRKLEEALVLTFPASDPTAVSRTPSAGIRGRRTKAAYDPGNSSTGKKRD